MLHLPRWKIIGILMVCLFGIVFSVATFTPSPYRETLTQKLKLPIVNLGLDLQGGAYLLLEADMNAFMKEQLETLQDDTRSNLRKAGVGFSGISTDAAQAHVTAALLPGTQKDAVKKALDTMFQSSEYTLDDNNLLTVTYRDSYLKQLQRDVLGQSIEIVRRRVDETGTKEPIIQRQGDNRIILQLPGLQNPEQLKRVLGQTAKMTFHMMNESAPFINDKRRPTPGEMILEGDGRDNNGQLYQVKRRALISGDQLVNAAVTYDQSRPVVSFRFNQQGGTKFAEITKENVGKPFAIVLDGKVISAPVIQSPILGGSGIITGHFTTESANDLALLLRAGALPVPLKIMEERTVGPSLGADSIAAGTNAAILGFALIVLMIVVIYRRFGVYASLALLLNMLLLVAVLSLFQATLTMPGIAGMVLTMGMAVDANVLIFERIREEVKTGKTPYAAVDLGFKEALRTILDSNITTLIATLLLYIFGTGPVRGFAVTLTIGVTCSMFSAIYFTRMLVVLWLKSARPKTLSF